MKQDQYYAYTRVSDKKQKSGASLGAQRRLIGEYARAENLTIGLWHEEVLTAATRGRPVFSRMIRELKTGRAQGVVMHKIDRGARNYRDWAELMDLLDAGVEVHFAADALDMTTRGGRLTADIQLAVAADYIRNLREEARKGVLGRLQEGLWPFSAPLGYLNTGKGRLKVCASAGGSLTFVGEQVLTLTLRTQPHYSQAPCCFVR